jgi:hypothetical protein
VDCASAVRNAAATIHAAPIDAVMSHLRITLFFLLNGRRARAIAALSSSSVS